MKKLVIGLTVGMLLGSAATAMAATNPSVQAVFAKFNVQIGEKAAVVVEPLVYDGTSYYPIRVIADLVGQDVDYDEKTRTIKLDQKDAEQVTSAEWISVREMGEIPELSVIMDNPSNTLSIKKDSIELKISMDSGSDTLQTNLGPIRIKIDYSSGSKQTLFSAKDLEEYGLIK